MKKLPGLLVIILALQGAFIINAAGKFLAAQILDLQVKKISIGLLLFDVSSIKIGETDFSFSLVPLLAKADILGESPKENVPAELWSRSLRSRSYSQRLLVILAGPFFNALIGSGVLWFLFVMAGAPQTSTEIGLVRPASPADRAGLKKGDRILEVSGQPVSSWEEITQRLQEAGDTPIHLKVQRQESTFDITFSAESTTIINYWGEEEKGTFCGIHGAQKLQFLPKRLGSLVSLWIQSVYLPTLLLVQEFFQWIWRKPARTPHKLARLLSLYFYEIFHKVDWKNIALLFASLNFFVFSIHLVPLLPMAGGDIVCLGFELICGRPLSTQSRTIYLILSFVILIFLLFHTKNDKKISFSFFDPWPDYDLEEF